MVILAVLAVPVLAVMVLGTEAFLAARGMNLPDDDPYALDGTVNPDSPGPALGVVWLGDSTAAGVGASEVDEALPRQVAQAIDRRVDLTVLAISGARIADVLDEQVPRLPDGPVDLVILSIGANDAVHLTSAGDFESRYQAVLDALPDDAAVVMLGVPDMGSTPRFAQPLRFAVGVRGGTMDAVVDDLAGEDGRTYVDIAGITGPEFRRRPGALFAADRYHPSDEGYVLWSDAVVAALPADVTG